MVLRQLIGAILVCRLELRQLPVDAQVVLALWRSRPAIEIVLVQRVDALTERVRLRRRLDEVYPC